jgi:hypothetical protein
MKKEVNKYLIKFFTEKDGYYSHKSKELEYFQEEIFGHSNAEAFKIAKNKLFNICKNEQWASHPLKEELIDDLDNLDDLLDDNNNYDYNKIIDNNDDPCDPEIIMEKGDSYYYYDCEKTYFKVFKIKKIKKNNQ